MKRNRIARGALLDAYERSLYDPDPPSLELVTGNNRQVLREVVKLIHHLCAGRPGTSFYLGSIALGELFDVLNPVALRWLKQLERQGIITRTWTGKVVRNDEHGNPIANGELVNRASKYVYHGITTA